VLVQADVPKQPVFDVPPPALREVLSPDELHRLRYGDSAVTALVKEVTVLDDAAQETYENLKAQAEEREKQLNRSRVAARAARQRSR
jgi:hypothetical protein